MAKPAGALLEFDCLKSSLHSYAEAFPNLHFGISGEPNRRVRSDPALDFSWLFGGCKRAPDELRDRLIQDLAGNIPKSSFHSANCRNGDSTTTPKTGSRIHFLPQAFDLKCIFTS